MGEQLSRWRLAVAAPARDAFSILGYATEYACVQRLQRRRYEALVVYFLSCHSCALSLKDCIPERVLGIVTARTLRDHGDYNPG
jgi:hypothetical protein